MKIEARMLSFQLLYLGEGKAQTLRKEGAVDTAVQLFEWGEF